MTKILLVDDDKSLREIYSIRLLAEGYTLVSAENGEEALALAISERPDLIVSDVMMPKISGFEMLDLLRSNENTRNIPVIMLTALSSEQQRERGDKLGADRYLVKSQVGIEDIVRIVHEILGDSNQPQTVTQMENSLSSGTSAQRTRSVPPVQLPVPTQPNNQNQWQSRPNLPAPNQSSFNPLAATSPAAVAQVNMPQMSPSPMRVPAIMNQPSMPGSSQDRMSSVNQNMPRQLNQQTQYDNNAIPEPDRRPMNAYKNNSQQTINQNTLQQQQPRQINNTSIGLQQHPVQANGQPSLHNQTNSQAYIQQNLNGEVHNQPQLSRPNPAPQQQYRYDQRLSMVNQNLGNTPQQSSQINQYPPAQPSAEYNQNYTQTPSQSPQPKPSPLPVQNFNQSFRQPEQPEQLHPVSLPTGQGNGLPNNAQFNLQRQSQPISQVPQAQNQFQKAPVQNPVEQNAFTTDSANSDINGQPSRVTAISNYTPHVPLNERVVQPINGGVNPRIDINDLLASDSSANAGLGSGQNPAGSGIGNSVFPDNL